MTQKTVAEIFVETLVAAGVTRIYGVVGDSLNGLLEQIRRNKKIEWIGVRHEETGAFAAGAQAHLTGELAVCAGSCGPGQMPRSSTIKGQRRKVISMPKSMARSAASRM